MTPPLTASARTALHTPGIISWLGPHTGLSRPCAAQAWQKQVLHLESPTLATYSLLPRIRQVMAVVPLIVSSMAQVCSCWLQRVMAALKASTGLAASCWLLRRLAGT